MKNNKGFTLLELLVVIAIIGLISTMAVVSLNSGREKARDSRRLSDIKQLQTAMEFHFDAGNTYAMTDTDCDSTSYPAANAEVSSCSDLATYMLATAVPIVGYVWGETRRASYETNNNNGNITAD